MKIFWKENNLWNKAKNIIGLYNKNFYIPETLIIETSQIKIFDLNVIDPHKKYIIRPSFEGEDSKKKSFAWFFKSIFPVSKKDIIKILKNENMSSIFNWKWYILKSLIIQEFIETDTYWIYFTRDPSNIFKKWLYEITDTNDWITSWNNLSYIQLKWIQKKELEIIWRKLEKIFHLPQDIEFCIKNNKIIVLQTRAITTWNSSIYKFSAIQKINWIYQTLDFDELWKKQDFFSYKIISRIFHTLYMDSHIYVKKFLFPDYLFKNIKSQNKNLDLFYKNYQKYLLRKIIFHYMSIFIFQKLNKKILKEFFQNYSYSFLRDKKSKLDLEFHYNTNFITQYFLKIEKQKNRAFWYLEKYKKEYTEGNFIWNQDYNLWSKLIFFNWILLNNTHSKETYNWIYKWKINGIITDIRWFSQNKTDQVLIIEDLDCNIFDKIDYLSWIIIKNGNLLSHNSIIFREYKIPSIIQYKNFNSLKVWEKIIL